MAKESAGLLLFRRHREQLEFLLVHPGGPFWRNKDAGAWTIPKGELKPGEDPLTAARRECQEELGFSPGGTFIPLHPIQQKAGKIVHAWSIEADWNPTRLKTNTFTLEWPPRSGNLQQFPEIDQAAFFDFELAQSKINPAQIPFLEELKRRIGT